jgi:hypothetical protein
MVTITVFATVDITEKQKLLLSNFFDKEAGKIINDFAIYFEYVDNEIVASDMKGQFRFTVFAPTEFTETQKISLAEVLHTGIEKCIDEETAAKKLVFFEYHEPESYAIDGILASDVLNA